MNGILAGVVLLFSFIIYFDTMAPTVSYWDCGEFIATSYILGVPHPPGSPLYLIIGRVFSMIPFSDDIAFRVNLISPIVSALAVMLLYLVIVQFVKLWRGPIKSTEDRLVVFGAGLAGSLTFAFTDSHWFNAVEAEVYAMSTLFTALVAWLILLWAERSEKEGNERYILIISYILGLATGVHLLNLLALPFMGLIIYFKKRQFAWTSFFIMMGIVAATFLVIYLGVVKGFPKLAAVIGVSGVVLMVVVLFGVTVFTIVRRHRLWSVVLSSLLLVTIGYSTYSILFIRSNQDPAIDENDPETIERAVKYLEREQYGRVFFLPREYVKDRVGNPTHRIEIIGRPAKGRDFSASQNLRYMFHSFGKQLDFLWNYQIVKMYLRYFLWQFAGRGPAGTEWVSNYGALESRQEDGVKWIRFGLPLPFVLGIAGMLYQFKKDRTHAFSVLTLFLVTGLAIIFYLNQDNPQPRERDYSYAGSFFAFSIWIGIGASAVLEKVLNYFREKPFKIHLAYGALMALILVVPGMLLSVNYHSHDRSGNFVAWDYSYNILQTCEPNAIIFTNGDNDTFPLWYLQEVEGIRKDVRVANLSLLNTEWYIRQLRDSRLPGERFINFSDAQIQGTEPIGRNPATGQPLYLEVSLWKNTPVIIPAANDPENEEGKISWEIKPTLGQGIRVQDLMVLHLIKESMWRYPIYFAVTVSQTNRIGLEKYLQMEGLAFRLKSHAVSPYDNIPGVDYGKLASNMATVVGDTAWSRDHQPGYRYRNLDNPDVYFNPNIVKLLQNYRSAFLQLARYETLKFHDKRKEPLVTDDEVERFRQNALERLELMSELIPEDVIPVMNEDMLLRHGQNYLQLGEIEKGKDIFRNLHDSAQPAIVGNLLQLYTNLGSLDEAISVLEKWLEKFPNDTAVVRVLREYTDKRDQATGS